MSGGKTDIVLGSGRVLVGCGVGEGGFGGVIGGVFKAVGLRVGGEGGEGQLGENEGECGSRVLGGLI